MPQKKKDLPWEDYISALGEQASIDQAQNEMAALTAREMYEGAFITNAPHYLVNRPTNHAMHGTVTNYPLDPVDVIKNVLVDGENFYKIEDWEHIRKEDFVRRAEKDHYTGQILSILICYPINDGNLYYWERYIGGASPTGEAAYVDEWGTAGNCLYTQYKTTTDDSEKTEELLVPETTRMLPFFPFVSVEWNGGVSIIDTVRTALIRLEASARVIATENIERRGMALYITGVDDISKIKKAPRRFGRNAHMLPTGANFVFPNSDVAGIGLLTTEQNDLWNSIEKATGVVSTEKLATLSGISRLIAEKPLNMLAEDLRAKFLGLLMDIYELISFQPDTPEPECTFLSLDIAPGFDNAVQMLDLMDRALASGAIDDTEWKEKARYLLSLGNKQ
jgi:hypothetical protein